MDYGQTKKKWSNDGVGFQMTCHLICSTSLSTMNLCICTKLTPWILSRKPRAFHSRIWIPPELHWRVSFPINAYGPICRRSCFISFTKNSFCAETSLSSDRSRDKSYSSDLDVLWSYTSFIFPFRNAENFEPPFLVLRHIPRCSRRPYWLVSSKRYLL